LVAKVGRVPADEGLSTLVREINLRLVKWRAEQIVSVNLSTCCSRWADTEPVEPERVPAGNPVLVRQRQELRHRQFVSSVQHVALVLSDNERQACNLGREVPQLDAPEVRQ